MKQHYTSLLMAAVIVLASVSAQPSGRGPEKGVEGYTVIAGDTLWNLAEQFFSDSSRWKQIWLANKHILDPDSISPGDRLNIAANTSSASEFVPQPNQNKNAAKALRASRQARPVDPGKELEANDAVYIDHLIDPDIPADNYFDELLQAHKSTDGWLSLDHSIELLSLYRHTDQEGSEYDGSTVDAGLHYVARYNSRNWGNFRLNLMALEEDNRHSAAFPDNNLSVKDQSGLVRFSLEQHNLPLNEEMSLNNIIGTHRQSRYNPFRERPNLINYRFGAAEPDVLGFSSQLLAGQTGLSISVGQLGQSRGNLLPGYVKTSGNVKRMQATHVLERHAFSGEVWETKQQETIANQRGYRLGYDRLIGHNTVLSFSGVGSGSQNAFLVGGATKTERAQHDFGSYYFQPDLIWLDQRIGDDNLGGFYRYQTRQAIHNWGGSIEVRKDGLANDAVFRSTSAYLSLNIAHRLSRKSTLSNVYNFRNLTYSDTDTDTDTDTDSLNEHSLRSYYSRTHRNNARSNLSLLARIRSSQQELSLSYGWAKDLQNDSSIELTTSYRTQFSSNQTAQELLVNTNWSKQFAKGTYISAGLGYNFGRSDLDDNTGLTGYLNLDQSFGPNVALSLQLDYSRERTQYDNDNIADTFFTNNQFEDDNVTGSRQFFAQLSLRYQRNGGAGPEILHSQGRSNGAGSVRGFVYVDSNGDGVRQASEPGVPGVTVFLNSVYPVRTNSRGEYHFPNVGLGSHFLFIDESALPLPWTLSHGEYTPLAVELRRSTQINIAVSPITLAEAE